MSIEQKDRILSKAEAAQYLGNMSESFVHAHATRKNVSPKIAFVRVGNRLKFYQRDLDAFLIECSNRAAAKTAAKNAAIPVA